MEASLAPQRVEITAPNWGYDLALDGDLITIAGTASADVETLTWTVGTATGSIDAGTSWLAEDLPLVPGDNTVVVLATAADGTESRDELVVTHNPGVPVASQLALSSNLAELDQALVVRVGIWASGPLDSVDVGPADGPDALRET